MPPPARLPVGLQVSRAAHLLGRAFDEALADAGGSLPTWLVLLNLKLRKVSSQRQLAQAVGITEATLTHHLNALDDLGLVTRRRDPANRRVHVVELTADGEAAFWQLRDAAAAFDQRLRAGIGDDELGVFADLLDRLTSNITQVQSGQAHASALEFFPPGAPCPGTSSGDREKGSH